MKLSSTTENGFSKFKEYYIRECKECGICYKNCFAYEKTAIPIHKYLKKLFQNNLDKKKVKKVRFIPNRDHDLKI